jgi:hypothetical protein
MIKASGFFMTAKPYAVDLASYRLADGDGRGELDAVWFRRKDGANVACAGWLWDYQVPAQQDAAGFLREFTDGRYGGRCLARWNGTNLWSRTDIVVTEADRERYRSVLVPMLAAFPAAPPGYDGWWVFGR